MLRFLSIKNFVLIEELRLELDKGLNVLTGETGAGKSIVLDALGLLLGDRFSSESVRQGATRSEIDGVFDAPETKTFCAWWEQRGGIATDEIVIRREGESDGRSRAFLNDRPVTLATLQELAPFLVDVHGQNEHQQILKPSVQLDSLDRFAGLESASDAIAPLFRAWRDSIEAINASQLSERERVQRLDLLRHQSEEIQSAKLKPGEDEELAQNLPELKNAERLREHADIAYGTLYAREGSVLEGLGEVEKALESLNALAPSVEPLLQSLRESKARLEETARDVQAAAERWQVDPRALDKAISRQDQLARLKRKYGSTVEEIVAHGQAVAEEIRQLENADATRQDLELRVEQARQVLDKASRALSTKRQKAAKELGIAVQKELADLGLKQAIFGVRIDVASPLGRGGPKGGEGPSSDVTSQPGPSPHPQPPFSIEVAPSVQRRIGPMVSLRERNDAGYTLTGIDRVIFEWAPNPGEGIQPLKNIASGGEMSRVMLALKTVLAQTDHIPTLVFDEVDAGIGGLTAQAVGKKLRALSRHHQLLCVSHLPQIAACAHAHFQVSKQVSKTRTQAHVVRLESNERLEELARLLGSQVTPTSVQHARELLAQNQ